MKKLCMIVGICLGILLSGVAWADTVRVKVRREVPADSEYYRMNSKGSLERVHEYGQGKEKTTIRDYYEKKGDTLYKRREVEGERQQGVKGGRK